MLNILLICFVHSSRKVCNEMFRNVTCGFYNVFLCTVAVRSKNVFCVTTFADVFGGSFNYLFVVSRVLFVSTLSLRRWWWLVRHGRGRGLSRHVSLCQWRLCSGCRFCQWWLYFFPYLRCGAIATLATEVYCILSSKEIWRLSPSLRAVVDYRGTHICLPWSDASCKLVGRSRVCTLPVICVCGYRLSFVA